MNRQMFMQKAKKKVCCETYPRYTFPGGYLISYVDKDNCVICNSCAFNDAIHDNFFGPVAPFIHWEGPALYCDECGKIIPAEYGTIEN